MTEVRTTVDEKLINNMAEKAIDAPIEDKQSDQDEQPQSEQSKISSEDEYDISSSDDKGEDAADSNTDEFGNEVAAKKVYTEEEVNELMRQRFNRTKKEESTKQTQNSQPQNESEDWEAQLEGFVENTVKKLTVKEQEKARQAQEETMQAEFQDKMLRGMGKYKDFQDVVGKMPISDPMLLATRQMKDPAAFIYAASKTQAKELERISKIPDPYYQAAEMGRLEERMRKVRAGTSSPKPVSEVKGDIANKENARANVDDLIKKDALKKLSNRRF